MEINYKELVDSIHDVVFQTDNNGNWTFLNNSWKQILGFEIDACIGEPLFNFLHPQDIEKNYKLFQPIITGAKSYCNHEIRYIASNRKIVWMNVFAILIKDDDGIIHGTSGTLRDVTADKDNREKVELLSNNISDFVCLHEPNGNYKYVSPSVTEIAGYLPEELVGLTPYLFFHPDDISKIEADHKQRFNNAGQEFPPLTYRFRHKNGTYKWFETNTRSIVDERGVLNGLVTSSRVVDIRKMAEEQTLKSLYKERELNQLKSRFVNMVSHEIRTPLAAVRSSTELIELYAHRTADLCPVFKKHTQNIYTEIDRLSDLIDDVLTVGKIEANTFGCKLELTDLQRLISQVLFNIEKLQSDKRKVNFNILNKLFERPVLSDPLLLNHIITNLLTNAFKYSRGKPSPLLTLTFFEKSFVFVVEDFGLGVPASQINRLFEAFFRGDNVHNIKGTGLGMFIIKNFIDLLDGTIQVTSEQNAGTTVTVTFNV